MSKWIAIAVVCVGLLTFTPTTYASGCLYDEGITATLNQRGELHADIAAHLFGESNRVIRVDVTVSRAGRVVRYEQARWRVGPGSFTGVATYRVPRVWRGVGMRVRLWASCGVVSEYLDVTRGVA